MSDLFPPRRPPRTYKLATTQFPSEIVQARVLAYLANHSPCGLEDFGRCDGLARVTIGELTEAISIQVTLGHVRMWFERVMIRNGEGKPSVARVARFALASPPDEKGGGS